MFRFASPDTLYLLLLIPVLLGLFVVYMRSRRKRLERFGERDLMKILMPDGSTKRLWYKFWLFLFAILLIIVAIARPQFGSKFKEVEQKGIEIMFVVDVSNSMLAEDFSPNRLERTKFSIEQLLQKMSNDRVGLIVFAGDAYVQLPVTSDYLAAQNFVKQISTSMVSSQGTAIGKAINLATNSFSSDSEGSRVVILISDGENHEDDALVAARNAKEKGVKIYSIGVGTPEGAPIMIGGQHILDEDGNMVVSKLNERSLEEIAVATDGGYIRASSRSIGLTEIVSKIDETEKKQFTARVFEEYNERFQYLIGLALVFLSLEFFVLRRKNRLLSRFDVFSTHDNVKKIG